MLLKQPMRLHLEHRHLGSKVPLCQTLNPSMVVSQILGQLLGVPKNEGYNIRILGSILAPPSPILGNYHLFSPPEFP